MVQSIGATEEQSYRSSPPSNWGMKRLALTSDSKNSLTSLKAACLHLYGASSTARIIWVSVWGSPHLLWGYVSGWRSYNTKFWLVIAKAVWFKFSTYSTWGPQIFWNSCMSRPTDWPCAPCHLPGRSRGELSEEDFFLCWPVQRPRARGWVNRYPRLNWGVWEWIKCISGCALDWDLYRRSIYGYN
jgi:hypothetical protein